MKKILILLIVLLVIGIGFLSGCNEQTEQKSEENSVPVIKFFTATPTTVIYRNSTLLNWSVEGATNISIDNGIGNVDLDGSLTIIPMKNQTYTLNAVNSYGSSNVSIEVYVIITNEQSLEEDSAPVIKFFTAIPTTVIYGDSTVLKWSVEGATNISIDNGIGNVSFIESYSFIPLESKKYILTASNEYGTTYAYVIVNVQKVD